MPPLPWDTWLACSPGALLQNHHLRLLAPHLHLPSAEKPARFTVNDTMAAIFPATASARTATPAAPHSATEEHRFYYYDASNPNDSSKLPSHGLQEAEHYSKLFIEHPTGVVTHAAFESVQVLSANLTRSLGRSKLMAYSRWTAVVELSPGGTVPARLNHPRLLLFDDGAGKAEFKSSPFHLLDLELLLPFLHFVEDKLCHIFGQSGLSINWHKPEDPHFAYIFWEHVPLPSAHVKLLRNLGWTSQMHKVPAPYAPNATNAPNVYCEEEVWTKFLKA